MANIFDGFEKISDQEIREQIAVLETVTMNNILSVYGQKAYKGLAGTINFLGSFFDKKVVSTPKVQEMDEKISEYVGSISNLDRTCLNKLLRHVLAVRSDSQNEYDDEEISIAVVDKAAQLMQIDQELSPAEKIEVVNQHYGERMLTEIRKILKEKGPEDQWKLERQLDNDIAQLSEEDKNAMREALKVEEVSGKTVHRLIMTAGSSTLILAAMSSFGGYIALTTIMHAVFTTALGITLPFAAYTGAASIVGFLTGPVGWAILAGIGIWQFTSGSSKVDGEVLAQAVFLARAGYKRPFTAKDEELPSWISPNENPEAFELRKQQEEEIARLQNDLCEKNIRLEKEELLRIKAEEKIHEEENKRDRAEKKERLSRENLKDISSKLEKAKKEIEEYEEQLLFEKDNNIKNEQEKQKQAEKIKGLNKKLQASKENLKELRSSKETMEKMVDEAEAQQEESSNTISKLTMQVEDLKKSCSAIQVEKEKAEKIANQKIDKRKYELLELWKIHFSSEARSSKFDENFLKSVASKESKILYAVEGKMKEIFDANNPTSVAMQDRGKMHSKLKTLHCKIMKNYRLHYYWHEEENCVEFVDFMTHNQQDKKF